MCATSNHAHNCMMMAAIIDFFLCSRQDLVNFMHLLTLTSTPSVCLQCSLSSGNTLSLRALRSITLSIQSINTQDTHLFTKKHIHDLPLNILSILLILEFHERTLWVGAQIKFHTGRPAAGIGRKSVRLFSSGAHD